MRNFRICENGSLEKRCGWRYLLTLPDTLRGLWQGSLRGKSHLFAVAGNTLYKVDTKEKTYTAVRTLSTSTGRVCFVVYRDTLLLLDGKTTYRLDPEKSIFTTPLGYVPLLGKDWHPVSGGESYETLNLLHAFYRVRYYNPGGYGTYRLPCPSEIMRIFVNGVEVYEFQSAEDGSGFTMSESIKGQVEVLALASDATVSSDILSSPHAHILNDGIRQSLLLGGGGAGYRIFVSAPVTEASVAEARVLLSSSDDLYFPAENVLLAGDSTYPIHTFCTYRGRAMAFNDRAVWSIGYANGADRPSILPVEHGVGCTSGTEVIRLDDELLLLNAEGLWRAYAPVGNPEEWTTEDRSNGMRSVLKSLSAAPVISCWVPELREYWIRPTEEEDLGLVYVYHVDRKEWYLYDAIHASLFLRLPEGYGFDNNGALCYFSESCYGDDDALPIVASYQSGVLTMGTPEDAKRVLSLSLLASGNGQLTLGLETEHCSRELRISCDSFDIPSHHDARVNLVRFHTLRFSIRADGYDRTRIYRLALYANP